MIGIYTALLTVSIGVVNLVIGLTAGFLARIIFGIVTVILAVMFIVAKKRGTKLRDAIAGKLGALGHNQDAPKREPGKIQQAAKHTAGKAAGRLALKAGTAVLGGMAGTAVTTAARHRKKDNTTDDHRAQENTRPAGQPVPRSRAPIPNPRKALATANTGQRGLPAAAPGTGAERPPAPASGPPAIDGPQTAAPETGSDDVDTTTPAPGPAPAGATTIDPDTTAPQPPATAPAAADGPNPAGDSRRPQAHTGAAETHSTGATPQQPPTATTEPTGTTTPTGPPPSAAGIDPAGQPTTGDGRTAAAAAAATTGTAAAAGTVPGRHRNTGTRPAPGRRGERLRFDDAGQPSPIEGTVVPDDTPVNATKIGSSSSLNGRNVYRISSRNVRKSKA
nr:hypothetical protein [Arthrobacter castelli]